MIRSKITDNNLRIPSNILLSFEVLSSFSVASKKYMTKGLRRRGVIRIVKAMVALRRALVVVIIRWKILSIYTRFSKDKPNRKNDANKNSMKF